MGGSVTSHTRELESMNAAPADLSPQFDVVNPALMGFPRNQWWVAAGRAEIGDALLSRRLLGSRVLLFRTEAGEAVALEDRCPHRALPLSLGKRIGDVVQCGYHGFEFGSDGRCVGVPSQRAVPSALKVRRYPLVERGLWAWIWMGDVALADESLIPNPGYDRPGYYEDFYVCVPMHANFQLLHENLLDTGHVSFVHPALDVERTVASTPTEVTVDGRLVRLSRVVPDFRVSSGQAPALGVPVGTRVHKTMIAETHLPCLNVTINRYAVADDPSKVLFEQIAYLPVVPASADEAYHFAGLSQSAPQQKDELVPLFHRILKEDADVLEAIQRTAHENGPGGVEVSVRADRAGIACRRMMAEMVRAE
jgi:vanillate O-demethylase monooxygenase subunit